MVAKLIESIVNYSPFLNKLINSKQIDHHQLIKLSDIPLPQSVLTDFADWDNLIINSDEKKFKFQLRQLRALVVSHIIIRDLAQLSDLNETMESITQFADFALNSAAKFAETQYIKRYGEPIGSDSNTVQHLSIIAMGKMGGYELNVSSDIDLIFTYPEIGTTNGERSQSNQDFFTKVVQKIINIINDYTENGQVFRVDIRLRPDGDAGPIVLCEDALEHYLVKQGREWERYAWTKARVITPYHNNIKSISRPFVFRKYLDFNSIEAMRKLHRQIRKEISREELNDNIKLGYGGIREIEFIAQIFQMIRGGQLVELQLKGTRETLNALQQKEILSTEQCDTLLQAYSFLRNTEHRLQYWQDEQTQSLPQDSQQQLMLAQSMGFANYPAFLAGLKQHRTNVDQLFNNILREPENNYQEDINTLSLVWTEIENTALQTKILTEYNFSNPQPIIEHLRRIKSSHNYTKISVQAQTLFDHLIPQLIESVSRYDANNTTLTRLLEFCRQIAGRSSYIALMCEYPYVINKLATILSQSKWMGDYLTKHPILLDELISKQLLDKNHDWSQSKQILIKQLNDCSNDTELQMNVVRDFQHAFIFRLGYQELEGLWSIESLSDQLSALADIILEVVMNKVWENFKKAHFKTPKFAIIGYGKLGGKELTYSSDLDLVYLYDDNYSHANENYTWFASRLTSFLSTTTSSGMLYNIDLRLRPNGDAGFLATEFTNYSEYQYKHAWTWEHQAITRARFICGDESIKQNFDALRKNILMLKRDKLQLQHEIIVMREKMLSSHPAEPNDVKHARGGIADVEFIVQYLVLAYSVDYSDLTHNYGNIALLKMAAAHKLIDPNLAEQARNAYRNYRRIIHNKVLHDNPPRIDHQILQQNYQAVKKLWFAIFNQEI